jgi:hypothetical protein
MIELLIFSIAQMAVGGLIFWHAFNSPTGTQVQPDVGCALTLAGVVAATIASGVLLVRWAA